MNMSAATLAVARGLPSDFGTIVRSEQMTLTQLAQMLHAAHARPVEFSFEQLQAADDATRKRLKKAPWFAIGTYQANRRSIDTLTSCGAVVLDVDRPGVTREALVTALDTLGCSYLAATSTSHGVDGQARYRVIIPLAEPVPANVYRAAWEHLAARIPGIDPGAKDPSRLNYMPRDVSLVGEVIHVDDRPWLDASTIAAVQAEPEQAGDEALLHEIDDTSRADVIWALKRPELLESVATYEPWASVGLALISLGDEGRRLWVEFSAAAPGQTVGGQSAEQWWRLNRRTRPKKDFRWIINRAEELSQVSRPSRACSADEFLEVIEAEPIPKVGEVPSANHLCTDLANAKRIAAHFANRLMVSLGGSFFAWSGTHWRADNGDARRFTCALTNIVKREADIARAKADKALARLDPELVQAAAEHPVKNSLKKTEPGAKALDLATVAEALEAWSIKCESKPTQDAALGMLRDLIKVDAEHLDANPWLLNCLNGTVDLRTGELRPHDPLDYLTRVAPVNYNPDAKAPRFEAFLAEIMGGDVELTKFLQRWFGYCATGDVREQKFLVHIGQGANGKGTLLGAVQDVLGDYCATAPLGLLTQGEKSERDAVALHRRRLVTAHEPDDNATLSEGFVKQATGGDRMSGRYLYREKFDFAPTHKLQMLSNHKPQIKGTDFGIWRRVLLLPYPIRFGTAEEIAAGKADRLRDDSLPAALVQEREGILRWLVQGAVAWFNDGGLQPPGAVKVAGRDYQSEQDRVGQFVDECCRLAPEASVSVGGLGGIYPAYQLWAKEAGVLPLGRNRFLGELERIVTGYRRFDKWTGSKGNQRRVRCVSGIELSDDGVQ